jgi:hypothetical protein
MTDCPVCHCRDWNHGVECIATRLALLLRTHKMRASEVHFFDEAFLQACGIVADVAAHQVYRLND